MAVICMAQQGLWPIAQDPKQLSIHFKKQVFVYPLLSEVHVLVAHKDSLCPHQKLPTQEICLVPILL